MGIGRTEKLTIRIDGDLANLSKPLFRTSKDDLIVPFLRPETRPPPPGTRPLVLDSVRWCGVVIQMCVSKGESSST